MTVLFADVVESTALAERLDPEDLHRVMQTYFEAMRAEIESEGGTVEKFIGDAVMAAFGVPTAHEDDPARALRAALGMTVRLHDVNNALRDRYDVELQIRIGVNTGEALTSIDPQPGESMVTGDVVSAAARLQTAAGPGQVLVAQRTARAVRGFTFQDAGQLDLRGKTKTVRAVLLTGAKSGETPRGVPGLTAPMVGRDYEMTLLRARYERVAGDGQTDMITLYGEPGVGKSRLTREFAEWTHGLDDPPTVLRGRCLPYGDGVTYWPLADILHDVAGIGDSDSSDVALQKIWRLGGRLFDGELAHDPESLTAYLAYTVGLEDPKYQVEDRDPREVRAAIHASWRTFFSALAREAPVVIVVEDIHWADSAMLDLLEHLAERVIGSVLFICPARPSLVESRPDWGGGRRNVSSISLDPLSPAASDQLIGLLLAKMELPDKIHDAILERSGGNPFFLEEIVRNLIDNGTLIREGNTWMASEGSETVEIPDTIQAALAARIDLLEPLEKSVLQKAAVVGRIFWPEPIERLLNGEGRQVRNVLEKLEERDLIRSQLGTSLSGEPEFIFQHLLTREVAYDSLPRGQRGSAHAAVADWIEEAAGERAGEFVEFRVYHSQRAYRSTLEDGTADAESLEHLRVGAYKATLAASIAARRRYAVKRALKLTEQALALATTPTEQAKALRQKGRVANSDYAGDLAWEALRESADITLANPPEDPREIARACAFAVETPTRWSGSMSYKVDVDVLKHYIDAGLAALSEDDRSPEKIRLLTARAFLWWGRIDGGESFTDQEASVARQAGETAVEMALELEQLDLASAALDAVGGIDVQQGQYARTIPIVERRLKISELIKNPWEIGDTYAMASWTRSYTSDYEGAFDIAYQGYEQSKDEVRGVQLHCLTWATYAGFWLGQWDRAKNELLPQVRKILGDAADRPPYFATHFFGAQAMISAIREYSTAQSDIADVARLVDVSRRSFGSLLANGWYAWIVARESGWDAAGEYIEGYAESPVHRPFLDMIMAEIMFDLRRLDGVEVFLADAREFAANNTEIIAAPHMDRLEGLAALSSGEHEESIRSFNRAKEGFIRIKTIWDVARTDLALAEAHRELGNTDLARSLASRSLEVFSDMSSIREIGRANAFLSDLAD